MKPRATHFPSAFTAIEIIIVVVVLALLMVLLMPALSRAQAKGRLITCNGLNKEIGTANRLWATDHGDLVPCQQSITNGGWKEFLTNANQGALCWTNYAIMQNELGQWPKLLLCPEDVRSPAASFSNHFGNLNVSYFVGVTANDVFPESIAGGDRNLAPGPAALPDFGFSPTDGSGNDVTIGVNSISNTVCWSLNLHSRKNPLGMANVLLGDGSVQECSSASFRSNWLAHAAAANTNWPTGHVPAMPSVRLVFP